MTEIQRSHVLSTGEFCEDDRIAANLHVTIEETRGDMGVYTGVNTNKSAIACMWEANTPFSKMEITGWYHTMGERPWVMNVIYIDDLHEWYTFKLSLHWRVCAGGVESGVRIRKVGPYSAENS